MIHSFRNTYTALKVAGAVALTSMTASAVIFPFNSDPFAGSDALNQPGRQVVGEEKFVNFNIATDVLGLGKGPFGFDSLSFFSGPAADLPDGGVNLIVLQEFGPPMAAGIAANLIAAEITQPGPGFFLYFNTTLERPRLVFSTDLSNPEADLKILFRLDNLRSNAMRSFTAANFAALPDAGGSAGLLSLAGGALLAARVRGLRKQQS